MKILGNSSGFMHLFATHPPIEARIDALGDSNRERSYGKIASYIGGLIC